MSNASTAATDPVESESALPKDASALTTVFLRDLSLIVAIFSIWAGAEAWAQTSGLGLATVLSSIGGLLVGAAVTALLHEWGHFIGARVSGGVAPISPAKNFLPLFVFDFARSKDDHFKAMSVGGNVAHWLAALLFVFALPGTSAGQVALQSGALGFAIFASVVEVPVIRLAFAGESGAKALSTITTAGLKRAGKIGVASAFLLFALL